MWLSFTDKNKLCIAKINNYNSKSFDCIIQQINNCNSKLQPHIQNGDSKINWFVQQLYGKNYTGA